MSDFSLFDRHRDENFSTALLVFALRNSQPFADAFFHLLVTRAGEDSSSDVRVLQVERDAGIALPVARRKPDVLFEVETERGRWCCLVEVKINAVEGINQLADYRAWLRSRLGCHGLLATLTRDHHAWSERPDVKLVWRDLVPALQRAEDTASGAFERNFWKHVRLHVEATMPTFEGFSSPAIDILGFLKEVDLFLLTLLRTMGVATSPSWDWHQNRAAYWVKELGATVGFWWWGGDWNSPKFRNALAVCRQGETEPVPVMPLEQLMERAHAAQEQGELENLFEDVGQRIRAALTA